MSHRIPVENIANCCKRKGSLIKFKTLILHEFPAVYIAYKMLQCIHLVFQVRILCMVCGWFLFPSCAAFRYPSNTFLRIVKKVQGSAYRERLGSLFLHIFISIQLNLMLFQAETNCRAKSYVFVASFTRVCVVSSY